MIQHFSFTFFPFFDFATQLFSTPDTSSNLCNQARLFSELRLLQATYFLPLIHPNQVASVGSNLENEVQQRNILLYEQTNNTFQAGKLIKAS